MIDDPRLRRLRNQLSFDKRKSKGVSEPYRTQEFLLNRAKLIPKPERRQTVSSFAGWVFDLCHEPRTDREYSLHLGKLAERVLRRSHRIPQAKPTDRLKLIFQDPLSGTHPGFKISALTVDGQPLFGVPDLVMKDKTTGAVLIYERKATRYSVPEYGWPNLKVQLWSYSWIDQFIPCDEIFLIGEIWRWRDGKLHLSSNIPRWRRGDEQFNAECEALFSAFGGTFEPPRQSQAIDSN